MRKRMKRLPLAALKSQAESEMIVSDSLIVVSSFLLQRENVEDSVLVGRRNVDSAGLQPESIYPDSDVHG